MKKTRKPRTTTEPLTMVETRELQEFLIQHNFCIKGAKKNIRVYRYLGTKNGRMITSRDFMYVVNADDYRKNKAQVKKDILNYSKQVFDKQKLVKNNEYVDSMVRVEEDLLMNHKVAMQWHNSKTVMFSKYNHVITDEATLAPLNIYVKNKTNNFITNRIYKTKDNKHLQIFQSMAQVFEEFNSDIPYSDWRSFRYVTRAGKVVAAYTKEDMSKCERIAFGKGIKDKFDYNLNVMNKDYINDVLTKFEA